jgi:hypothetical protein
VSRQVSISVNSLSGGLLVSITHTPCFDFFCMTWSLTCFVFELHRTCALLFPCWPRGAAMYPGTFEITKSLLLSDVDAG